MLEYFRIGKYSKQPNDVICEDTETWEQRFKCLECGVMSVYFPEDDKWKVRCGCMRELVSR